MRWKSALLAGTALVLAGCAVVVVRLPAITATVPTGEVTARDAQAERPGVLRRVRDAMRGEPRPTAPRESGGR
jgi:hypothetical protein